MTESTFDLERKYHDLGYGYVIGIDEAGRGPLAGPVVAAATMVRNFQFPISNFRTNSSDQILNNQDFYKKINLIRDSKKLSEKQRESLYDFIHEYFYVGVGHCDNKTIDRINVLEAAYLAMKKAVSDLKKSIKRFNLSQSKRPEEVELNRSIILIDGNRPIPNLSMEQKAIVSGDKLVKSISAASIIAKVTRDRIMRDADEIYPQYGFIKHKGYGTKMHTDAIKKYGPCPIHRSSFEPIKSWTKA